VGVSYCATCGWGKAVGMNQLLPRIDWEMGMAAANRSRNHELAGRALGRKVPLCRRSSLFPWRAVPALGLLACAAVVISLGGCHRAQYRQDADREATNLIREKINDPHWALPRQSITVDPRSRMFDPFNPDLPPMPQDDPASHQLMHRVDGKHGYPHWDASGHTPFAENPEWMAYLPLDSEGVLPLTAQQAYQMALMHSRTYQQQFETLYLSALDVSVERFRFDTQFFGGYSGFYTASGQGRGSESRLDLDTFTSETGRLALPAGGVTAPTQADWLMRKSFTTGADLAVGIANSLVWDFSGPNEHSALTIVDFSLIQPLLRRAGRDRILEQLTLAERALLANVRQMERYRRTFYVEIMTGRDAGQGASRRGGVFGASGLEGFSGLGSGGFGRVGTTTQGFGGTGAAQAGGYLGLLQDQQDIRNQQITISGLRTNLAQLRDSMQESLTQIPDDPELIVRERLQIAQSRQALLNAESRLLIAEATYQSTLDAFKIRLGLPPGLCVHINDSLLDQFNLMDPEMLSMQNQVNQLRDGVALVNGEILNSVQHQEQEGRRVPLLTWSETLAGNLQRLRSALDRTERIRQTILRNNVARAHQDIERLRAAIPQRRQQLDRLSREYQQELDRFQRYGDLDPSQMKLLADIDPLVFDSRRLDRLPTTLSEDTQRVQGQFESYAASLQQLLATVDDLLANGQQLSPGDLYTQVEQRLLFVIPGLLSDLSDDVLDLSLVEARARTDTVQLSPIELTWDQAFDIARRYRHDWMNARAALVDSWRLIEFNADNLESVLDVVLQGDIRNTGDNPLRLNTTEGQIRAGLRFDAPLTRLQERNTYRQALIEYQQARRGYYAYVDAVAQGLRTIVRTIDLNQLNFEERRIAVLSAIDQVVLNDEIQKLREDRGMDVGVTAARDVVSALGDLQAAQNDFLSVWVNYEVQRMYLDLDLGTMRLDSRGEWIDPGPIGPEHGYPAPDGDGVCADWPRQAAPGTTSGPDLAAPVRNGATPIPLPEVVPAEGVEPPPPLVPPALSSPPGEPVSAVNSQPAGWLGTY